MNQVCCHIVVCVVMVILVSCALGATVDASRMSLSIENHGINDNIVALERQTRDYHSTLLARLKEILDEVKNSPGVTISWPEADKKKSEEPKKQPPPSQNGAKWIPKPPNSAQREAIADVRAMIEERAEEIPDVNVAVLMAARHWLMIAHLRLPYASEALAKSGLDVTNFDALFSRLCMGELDAKAYEDHMKKFYHTELIEPKTRAILAVYVANIGSDISTCRSRVLEAAL